MAPRAHNAPEQVTPAPWGDHERATDTARFLNQGLGVPGHDPRIEQRVDSIDQSRRRVTYEARSLQEEEHDPYERDREMSTEADNILHRKSPRRRVMPTEFEHARAAAQSTISDPPE